MDRRKMPFVNLNMVPEAQQTQVDLGLLPPQPVASKRPSAPAPQAAPQPAPEVAPEAKPDVMAYIREKYGIGQPDAEMEAAQEAARQNRMFAGLAEAGATIGGAIGRTQVDKGFYDKLRAGADAPVSDLKTLRGEGDAQLDRAMKREKLVSDEKTKMQEDDATSEVSRSYQQLAKRMSGQNFDGKSASEIKRLLPSLEKIYNIDQTRLGREESRRFQAALLGHKDAVRQQDKLDAKKTKIAEVEGRRQDIMAALDTLDKMVAEDGTFELFGSHNQDMDRLVDQISTDMAKLQDPDSVARPSEVEMVKRGLVQPGLGNRNSTARDIIRNFRGEVDRRAENAYRVRGLESPGSMIPSGQGAAPQASFPRQVRKGNQVATVSNEQELQEALSEGFK